ncbi:N-acyl homoserine lactonase family protein [Catellatospora sp. KI3]|uniref:N-acyl homoserine lactonase family protein n=1 Tax=Catellatospora sp. KI3 TaxID=3041620 RepID=UPI002482B26A|nr:N-acyl homoserine lactonase family protein [Catellatospora sp. KI3]MDI1463686.1 N-acyl homoserine lactonase family protein [Catellatospora sp. KI3]
MRIRRLDLGYFIRPAAETGGPRPRAEAVLGYVVEHDGQVLLFDTGIGRHPWTDDHYRPRPRPIEQALADAGLTTGDVDVVANCHLHFDHSGGNPRFARVPIMTQAAELDLAGQPGHTLPGLVDFTGADYRRLDGDTEIWPGVWLIATPGHTAGHQSLVALRPDGTVVLAGQAHDFASEFSTGVLGRTAGLEHPAWLERILSFDPRRVLFAHDAAVWEPATDWSPTGQR